jgi:hypothetical protein
MARCQRDKDIASPFEERIGADDEPSDSPLKDGCECRFEIAFGADGEREKL